MTKPRLTSARAEMLIVAAVAVAGFLIGSGYERTFRGAGLKAPFGQQEFAAAVALACGRGFVDVGGDVTPEMHQFRLLERDTFDCAGLPPDAPHDRPNLTQGLYRYLMLSVAAVWILNGAVSWSVLGPLFGVFYALTLMGAYGLFRFAMGRTLAIVMTAAVAVSPVHLNFLVYLRDYAKAPFILALILIMLWLAKADGRRRSLIWSAAFGAVLGIGFGFRNDIMISALPFLAVVALFVGRHDLRGWAHKAACVSIMLAAFVVTAWPILTAYSRGSNSGHVALLGLSPIFDDPIGVKKSIYGWGYGYSDNLAATMINDYTIRTYGHTVSYLSAEYDQRMVEYIAAIARQWPADMLVRTYAAAGTVLQFPFDVDVYARPVPPGIQASWAIAIYGVNTAILELLTGRGVWFVGAALLLLASQSTAAAVALFALLVYFAGYPVLQFDVRHFFHLEFIPWLAIGYLLQRAADLARGRLQPAGASWRRALLFAAGVLAVVVVPVVILRVYQASHVRHLIATDYVAAPRQRLDMEVTPAGPGRTRLALPTLWADRDRRFPFAAEYLAVTLSGSHCAVDQLTITFRYTAKTTEMNFTHAITASVLPGGATQIFFPAYFSDTSELTGLETSTPDAPCIEDVSRVARASLPPLLLNLTLTPHWETAKLFQTVQAVEIADSGDGAPWIRYASPYDAPMISLAGAAPVTARPSVVRLSPSGAGWRIQGRPPAAYSQVVEFAGQQVAAGDALVAEGELASNTPVTIGTQKDGRWVSVVNVTRPGPFVATLMVPEAGEHTVVIADFTKPWWIARHAPWLHRWIPSIVSKPRSMDVVIKRLGWASANSEH